MSGLLARDGATGHTPRVDRPLDSRSRPSLTVESPPTKVGVSPFAAWEGDLFGGLWPGAPVGRTPQTR